MNIKDLLQLLKQRVRQLLGKIGSALFAAIMGVKNIVFGFLFHRLTIGITAITLGFLFGSRMHEIGFLEGLFGKSLRGATVFLSGPCKVNGVPRIPALAEDEVKITGEEPNKITGVIRKTREVVECDTSLVAIDKLPLLANLNKSPVKIPELEAMKVEAREPEFKKLIQKTLLMSGSCIGVSGKELPPFTDEKVDVTNAEAAKDNPNAFIITGIKKSDKIAISCLNTAVKYSIYEEKPEEKIQADMPSAPKSYVGETILVTSTCFPDPRLPKHKQDKKVAFYPLVNSRVQVTEELLDANGKIKKLAGAALDFGSMIVCDGNKFPLTYKEYDPESMKLNPLNPSQSGLEQEEKEVNQPTQESASAGKETLKGLIRGVN